MRLLTIVVLSFLVSVFSLRANVVSDYFDNCRKTGSSDYSVGMQIVKNHDTAELLDALEPYYADTVAFVRQQACYLTYKKGLEQQGGARSAVARLAKGLNDDDSGLRGMIIGYLQAFPLAAFDEEAKGLIGTNLSNPNSPHFDELVLLAGFVGAGSSDLLRLSMNPDLPVRKKWNISLALARMGSENALQSCLDRVKKAPVNSQAVAYLMPDLVYTRQKAALDYCVELLYSNEKLCKTANPDLSESILCAYPIIELIAPVIVGFPIYVNPSIGIDTDDYEALLQTIRTWLEKNKEYEINKEEF